MVKQTGKQRLEMIVSGSGQRRRRKRLCSDGEVKSSTGFSPRSEGELHHGKQCRDLGKQRQQCRHSSINESMQTTVEQQGMATAT